jgi:tRNA threonylcarbamoyl adenosine modification protein YjeE
MADVIPRPLARRSAPPTQRASAAAARPTARRDLGYAAAAMLQLPDVVATQRLGARLAAAVRPGDVIALIGDLGAGKTTLVDACVRALGGDGAHSPTFALVHQYPCSPAAAVGSVWHLDLYRLEREVELRELGLEEILGNPAGIAFVEWADRFAVLPADHLALTLQHAAAGRALALDGRGPRGRQLAAALADAALPAAVAPRDGSG